MSKVLSKFLEGPADPFAGAQATIAVDGGSWRGNSAELLDDVGEVHWRCSDPGIWEVRMFNEGYMIEPELSNDAVARRTFVVSAGDMGAKVGILAADRTVRFFNDGADADTDAGVREGNGALL
ncbi:MAG: hypothetical protein ABWX63_04925 [Paeniglutamicibacter terrestris]